MPNPREPIDILAAKGRKHLTKEEIAQRRAQEPKVGSDNIKAPAYLNAAQRAEFFELAGELVEAKIFGNVDAGELARYVVAHSMYGRYVKLLRTLPKKKRSRLRELREQTAAEAGRKTGPDEELDDEDVALELEKNLTVLLDKYFSQCEQCARSLGLNITSRCKLVIPAAPPVPKTNKFDRYKKGEAGTG